MSCAVEIENRTIPSETACTIHYVFRRSRINHISRRTPVLRTWRLLLRQTEAADRTEFFDESAIGLQVVSSFRRLLTESSKTKRESQLHYTYQGLKLKPSL